MARYDVFPDPNGAGYLLDVQADIIEGLDTRVVVPLLPDVANRKPVRLLNPVFVVEGRRFVIYSQLLVAIPKARLGTPRDNFLRHHDEIADALDMVFYGF